MNRFLPRFNRVVLIGALINIFGMALPFIFAPQWYLDYFGLPGGGASIVWMRQAGLLLFLVSVLYIPGGIDPFRYSLNAKFAIFGRTTIGLYWIWLVLFEDRTRAFLQFGFFDFGYAIFNGIFLYLLLREEKVRKRRSSTG